MTQESTAQARIHAVVRGHVQGVNFRYHTMRTARRLGLTGWVANRRDGAVEVVAEGRKTELEDFVDFLHRGSPAAMVENLEVDRRDPTGDFEGFRVRYL